MKAQYQTPYIRKVETGMAHKAGKMADYTDTFQERIEGVSIDRLVKEFGSPLFVFSEKKIRERFRKVSGAFESRYPKVTFGWSYKTNYLDAVCALFHQEGAVAEVVSGMEYEKARRLGVPGSHIIFNGPCKSEADLRRAVADRARIHIDHMDELYLLEQIAKEVDRKIQVGIRINMDTGIYPQWSRFGFNLESGQAMAAARRIKKKNRLVLTGLHSHIGTYILDPDAYGRAIKKLMQFSQDVDEASGFKITYIDLGGGFPSRSRLKGSYHGPEIVVPPIEDYAEAITQALFTHAHKNLPELVLESGRSMIDSAGSMVSTIMASKRLPDGRKAYVADAGINLLPTSQWYKHHINFDHEICGAGEPSVIYGPLCMNIDVIEEHMMLPALKPGTRMILSPVGAYNVTQWMQFIHARPAVVLIGENREIDLIREPEDLSDIVQRERLPKRLAQTPAIHRVVAA